MELQRQTETGRAFKQRVSDTLRTMSTAATKARELRNMQLQLAMDWSLVWGKLDNVILPVGVRSTWYMVIHAILSTNVRLHRIRL